jgi:lipopolysaccharide/colanic/teichoic acid biosynthesis glycosyltransferase
MKVIKSLIFRKVSGKSLRVRTVRQRSAVSTYDGFERYYARGKRIEISKSLLLRDMEAGGGTIEVREESGLPMLTQDGRPILPAMTLSRGVQLALKRWAFDLPLAMLALLALFPLLLAITVAIRVSSRGPVLFGQLRVGRNGKLFRLFKFRTLRIENCDDSGLNQTVANDGRQTRLGRFLRATSLDELPQLWNIIIGDMSVIGPRPMVEGQQAAGRDYREVVPYYDYRQLMRPGLSGWAQANGLRGSTREYEPARRRIDHDCAYIQNFSLGLDIKIVARTIIREFLTGSGV